MKAQWIREGADEELESGPVSETGEIKTGQNLRLDDWRNEEIHTQNVLNDISNGWTRHLGMG